MAKLQITQSVGLGGVNKPNDIKAVQAALNQLLGLISPTKKLVEDGKLGPKPENSKTVAAIKAFQKKVVGMVRPDGKIDANGRSHRKFNEKLCATAVAFPISGDLKVKLRAKLEEYENRLPHMYLDSKGYVTVGVGHLLQDAKAAQKLAFVNRETGVTASAVQIQQEFDALYALTKSADFNPNYRASYYKKYTTLTLNDNEVDRITNEHIVSFEKELKQIYGATEFSAYPDNVKLALFDMIFNLGMTRLKNIFIKFNRSIKSGDFAAAALECNRPDVNTKRNDYVRNLLRM